jgi:hypothetical protein
MVGFRISFSQVCRYVKRGGLKRERGGHLYMFNKEGLEREMGGNGFFMQGLGVRLGLCEKREVEVEVE